MVFLRQSWYQAYLTVPHHTVVFQVGRVEFVFIKHLNPAGVLVGVSELSTSAGCIV